MPLRAPSATPARLNADPPTVENFGDEWTRFPQNRHAHQPERAALLERYFGIFPWPLLRAGAVGFDFGCGTGRWAAMVAPRVGQLHCVDASPAALAVARANLRDWPNCQFTLGSAENIPLADGSADFGYALGVLHHLPDPAQALRECVRRLKPGAPFLLYVYYDLGNRPRWYRRLWQLTIGPRRFISRLPRAPRLVLCDVIAALAYLPLARLAKALERTAVGRGMPLAFYRDCSFYTMRTDALDRFGTPLEKRFSRAAVTALLLDAGLERVQFSATCPFWVALGYRRAEKDHMRHA